MNKKYKEIMFVIDNILIINNNFVDKYNISIIYAF